MFALPTEDGVKLKALHAGTGTCLPTFQACPAIVARDVTAG
jgi:hypothetical protein